MTVATDPYLSLVQPACGHVGCCDSSPLRHARWHAFAVRHPIVASLEPGESWRWCHVDEAYV